MNIFSKENSDKKKLFGYLYGKVTGGNCCIITGTSLSIKEFSEQFKLEIDLTNGGYGKIEMFDKNDQKVEVILQVGFVDKSELRTSEFIKIFYQKSKTEKEIDETVRNMVAIANLVNGNISVFAPKDDKQKKEIIKNLIQNVTVQK